tara:strand:+ start:189 stop:473 length:285 start_codon:yes stop_codon:yes gene_type:complete
MFYSRKPQISIVQIIDQVDNAGEEIASVIIVGDMEERHIDEINRRLKAYLHTEAKENIQETFMDTQILAEIYCEEFGYEVIRADIDDIREDYYD